MAAMWLVWWWYSLIKLFSGAVTHVVEYLVLGREELFGLCNRDFGLDDIAVWRDALRFDAVAGDVSV